MQIIRIVQPGRPRVFFKVLIPLSWIGFFPKHRLSGFGCYRLLPVTRWDVNVRDLEVRDAQLMTICAKFGLNDGLGIT